MREVFSTSLRRLILTCDLLTLKASAMATHMMITFTTFRWNPSTKWRDIAC